MKAISIRQPWAWLIVRPDITDPAARAAAFAAGEIKDIENRDWPTKVRGRVLVHASKGMTEAEYEHGVDAGIVCGCNLRQMPDWKRMERGGIVGSVEIVDCVRQSKSRWFVGDYGFVLRDPMPQPFVPVRGQLGFFEVEMPA